MKKSKFSIDFSHGRKIISIQINEIWCGRRDSKKIEAGLEGAWGAKAAESRLHGSPSVSSTPPILPRILPRVTMRFPFHQARVLRCGHPYAEHGPRVAPPTRLNGFGLAPTPSTRSSPPTFWRLRPEAAIDGSINMAAREIKKARSDNLSCWTMQKHYP